MNREELKEMDLELLLKEKRKAEFLFTRYNNLQKVKKVQLNSCYGALGNPYFRMFDARLAKSVTRYGQFIIQWIDNEINKHFNKVLGTNSDYVVFAHTDSMYITLDQIVSRIYKGQIPEDPKVVVAKLVEFCQKKIYPKIVEIFESLSLYLNAYENKMHMKMEIVADKGIFEKKNRYILNVYYDEGVVLNHPSLKMVGIEAIRSSVPMICRKKMIEALEVIMRKDVKELRNLIRDFRVQYAAAPLDDIAFPTGVKGIVKFADPTNIYTKLTEMVGGRKKVTGCPRHIKAGLIYNHLITTHKLDKKYKTIADGDKIKYIALLENNPIGHEVVAFKEVLPPEFGIESHHIDKASMLEKSFLTPIEKFADLMGWTIQNIVTIESMLEGIV